MPFCREKVENPAVNYRGAKKIGGAKTRSGSVERGTDIPKIKPKIGNTAFQTRQVKDWIAAVLPGGVLCRTVAIPPKHQSKLVFMRYHSQIHHDLSLICR